MSLPQKQKVLESNMDRRYVYLLKALDTYKIGVTKNVEQRIKQLQTGNDTQIILVDKFLSEFPFKLESVLHRKYDINNVNGEWYYLSNEDVKNFQNDCLLIENNFKCLKEFDNPYM